MDSDLPTAVQLGGTCADCLHFDNRATAVEAALPGMRALGSAYGSVRAQDGLCQRHGRYLAASSGCTQFESSAGAIAKR